MLSFLYSFSIPVFAVCCSSRVLSFPTGFPNLCEIHSSMCPLPPVTSIRHQTFAHHHSRANQGFPTHSHTRRSITHLRRATESLSMDRSHSGDRLVHYAILLRKKGRHQFQTQYLDSLYSPRHNHRCGQRVVRQISHVARLRPNDRTSMVLLLSNGDDDRYSLCIMVSQT